MSSNNLKLRQMRKPRTRINPLPPSYEENQSEGPIAKDQDEGDGDFINDEIQIEDSDLALSKDASELMNAFSAAINLRKHVKKWSDCVRSKRKIGIKKDGSGTIDVGSERYVPVSGYVKLNEMGICELGSDIEEEVITLDNKSKRDQEKVRRHNARITQSQALLHYFAKLARSDDVDEEIDMEFVHNLIQAGADVNTRDVFGQSLLHEVARAWHVSVAAYLIEIGADVNSRDYLGRTPLHVAAAVDYSEMIDTLLDNGATLEARTYEEHQTPLHFAARNDAGNALVRLVKCRAELEAKDYKERTPLHVAAELDRSETASLLLEYGANAGVCDTSGMSTIVLMVRKMSPVAKEALDQFHKKDRANRKQMFYLNKLEHAKADESEDMAAQSVLQVVVDLQKLDLITHPIFERLIEVKWDKFGRNGALFQLVINFLFVLSWTVQALAQPAGEPWRYDLPDDIWRIVLYGVSILLWVYQFVNEIIELTTSRKTFARWVNWRKAELEKDFKYVHQRWPEEESFLRLELQSLQSQEPSYFRDFWNTFDWITYVVLLLQLIMHVIDINHHNQTLSDFQTGTFAIAIILIWVRLMKNFRAFRTVGPFIVICTYMIKDIFKWLFLYLLFYIPYCVAFYMVFGRSDIPGYDTFDVVMYSLFRITLVDDYGYDDLQEKSQVMAQILCGSFLALSSIVMLNLFIALMSDTFQRVYDNAQANALLQQASFIQSEEEGLKSSKRRHFRDYIHSSCAPLKDYYDDDWDEPVDDLKKVTTQIKEQIDDYLESVEDEKRERDMDIGAGILPQDLQLLRDTIGAAFKSNRQKCHKEIKMLRAEVLEMKSLLLELSNNVMGRGGGGSRRTDVGTLQKQISKSENRGGVPNRIDLHMGGDEDDEGSDDGAANRPKSSRDRLNEVVAVRRTDSSKNLTSRVSKASLLSAREEENIEEGDEKDDNMVEDSANFEEEPTSHQQENNNEMPPNYRSRGNDNNGNRRGENSSQPPQSGARLVSQRTNEDLTRLPRQNLRQIQVVPDDNNDQLANLLARYETMDFSDNNNNNSNNMLPAVSVRTRNVNMPPAYNGRGGNNANSNNADETSREDPV